MLSDFAVFSGSGLSIGGHNLVNGHIGSNQNLDIIGPTQINGSVYVGGDLTVGSNSAIGSDGVTLSPDLQSSTRYHIPHSLPGAAGRGGGERLCGFLGRQQHLRQSVRG